MDIILSTGGCVGGGGERREICTFTCSLHAPEVVNTLFLVGSCTTYDGGSNNNNKTTRAPVNIIHNIIEYIILCTILNDNI